MKRRISESLRKWVAHRAGYRCEYCRVHQDDLFLRFEIDHIVAVKHGGNNDPENLAFACPHCNILPKSKIGQATIKLLQFNDTERLIHRQLLTDSGRYP